MVPPNGIGITHHPPHLPTYLVTCNIPIEAVITKRIDFGIPIAVVMALTAHEQQGSARQRHIQGPTQTSLCPRIPVVAPRHSTADPLHKGAVLPQAIVAGPLPLPHAALLIVGPPVIDLLMGTQQVLDRARGRWVAKVTDEGLEVKDIAVSDDTSECVSTAHIPASPKTDRVEDRVRVTAPGTNEFIGEVGDHLLHNGFQTTLREVLRTIEPQAIDIILLEPHRRIFDEKPLHCRRIMIGTTTEVSLYRAQINPTTSRRIALVAAMIRVTIELPEVMHEIHVVVDHIQKDGQSSAMTGINEIAQVVRRAIEHFWGKVIARIVGFSLRTTILSIGRDLNGVEVHAPNVIELRLELSKAGNTAKSVLVDHEVIIASCEGADMRLIDDEVLEGWRLKRCVELEGGRINDKRG